MEKSTAAAGALVMAAGVYSSLGEHVDIMVAIIGCLLALVGWLLRNELLELKESNKLLAAKVAEFMLEHLKCREDCIKTFVTKEEADRKWNEFMELRKNDWADLKSTLQKLINRLVNHTHSAEGHMSTRDDVDKVL